MRKLSKWLGAATLALGSQVALAQEPPGTTGDDVTTPDRPIPSPTADQPDPTMPSESPGLGKEVESERQPVSGKDEEGKADKHSKMGSSMTMGGELQKRIGFVDLYINDAMNSAKTLAAIGDAQKESGDKALIQEARRNLDQSIDKALTHVKKLDSLKSDLAGLKGTGSGSGMSGSASDGSAKVDELERHLTAAKSQVKKLASAKQEGLSRAVDDVSTHLVAARGSFRDLAKMASYTLLEDTTLGTVPVSGEDPAPSGEVDRDLGTGTGSSPGATTPDTTSPSGTTPGGIGTPSPTGTSPDTTTTPGDLDTPPSGGTGTRPTDTEKSRGQTTPGSTAPEPTAPAPGGSGDR